VWATAEFLMYFFFIPPTKNVKIGFDGAVE